MRVIQYPTLGQVIVTEQQEPRPQAGEVLVKVRASGLCHTDLDVLFARYGKVRYPLVPGHEFAGEVVEVGPGVTHVKVGARVAVDPNLSCGHCRACLRGKVNLCTTLGAYGVSTDGGFAEYAVTRADQVHDIGDLDYSTAALAEPLACVLNGVANADPTRAQNALVIGAGPIGLLLALAFRAEGVADVSVADLDEARLAFVESLGLTPLRADSEALTTRTHGFDLAAEATGVPAVAGSLPTYTADGGTILFFGVAPKEATVALHPFEIFRRELRIVGSHSLPRILPKAITVLQQNRKEMSRLVSDALSLDEMARVMTDKSLRAGRMKQQFVAH